MEMLTIPRKFQILEIRVARWGKIAREASPVQVRLGCDPVNFCDLVAPGPNQNVNILTFRSNPLVARQPFKDPR